MTGAERCFHLIEARRFALARVVLAAVFPLIAQAREIDPAERREVPFDASLPACHQPEVLSEIAVAFATRDDRFWNSGLRIAHFAQLRQVSWRPWGLDYIPRRFCTGRVVTNDGRVGTIHYSIREDLGITGAHWGSEWCVVGLDRHFALAPNCNQARP